MGTISAIASVFMVLIAALGLYIRLRGSGREKQKQAERAAENARKDADIASEPFVDNPLDGMRKKAD